MKKLISVIVMLIFILPFSMAEAGNKDKRYKKNERQYYKYEKRDRGKHRGHDHSRYYNKYRHKKHSRRYVEKRHYRDRHAWDRHRRNHRDRYRHGEYHYDRDNKLKFSYCQQEGDRRSNKEVCFSISIGD